MGTSETPALAVLAATLLGCGVVLLRRDPDRVLAALFLAAGAAPAAGTVVSLAGGPQRLVTASSVVGLVVLLPVAVVRASGAPWRHPLVRLAVAVCVVAGVVALVLDGGWVSGGALVTIMAAGACWWAGLELAPSPRVRQELLWPVAALLPALVLLVPVGFLVPEREVGVLLALLLVPLPVAIVTVRVRRVPLQGSARRTVVEGAATAAAAVLVFAAFVGVSAVLSVVLGHDPAPDVLGFVAVACAAAFEPARRALRGTAEAILYGARQDPLAAAARVGAHVAEDPAPALRALVEVLDVPYARLDVAAPRRDAGAADAAADAAADPAGRDVEPAASFVEVAHVGDPDAPGDPTALALRLGEQEVGRLVITPRRGDGSLSASDARVVAVVAPALAQTLRARRLAQDLATSRGRTLVATQEERRRVRRDLHDGLGPTLSGIAYTADAAANTLADDPDTARALVDRVRADARTAVAEVRRIVEGMRPPALDELGLVGAIDQRVSTLRASDGAPLVVGLTASASLGAGRLAAAVEVAAYRIVVEAVTNVARHSGAHRADVVLLDTDDALLVEVRDLPDEVLDDLPDDLPGARPRLVPGVGVASMRERATELAGSFDVAVEDGGVVVRATLPYRLSPTG